MEHAQRDEYNKANNAKRVRLNPYFNGTCSKRYVDFPGSGMAFHVLILILMEHAQRVQPFSMRNKTKRFES